MQMPVMFVHQTVAVPYADAIAAALKPIETRTRNVLRSLIGQRVAIARTRSGHPAEIVGYVTVTAATWATAAELDTMRNLTLIPKGSRYDCTGAGKWCYHLADAESRDPIRLDTLHIVRKNRSYCVIDA